MVTWPRCVWGTLCSFCWVEPWKRVPQKPVLMVLQGGNGLCKDVVGWEWQHQPPANSSLQMQLVQSAVWLRKNLSVRKQVSKSSCNVCEVNSLVKGINGSGGFFVSLHDLSNTGGREQVLWLTLHLLSHESNTASNDARHQILATELDLLNSILMAAYLIQNTSSPEEDVPNPVPQRSKNSILWLFNCVN